MPSRLRWEYLPEPSESAITALAESLFPRNLLPWHRVMACLLLQRGLESVFRVKEYFSPTLKKPDGVTLKRLSEATLMSNMLRAVDEISATIERKERILIYGDYDVDGTCAVSILYLFLKKVYPDTPGVPPYPFVLTYVPDRYKEGYGVSQAGIDYAVAHDVKLIITLDCGIQAHEMVLYAKKYGIRVIVTDHHTPSKELPQAFAVLNPKLDAHRYPKQDVHRYSCKELCGAGIAFKLVQALCERFSLPQEAAYTYLDLVALATCADIVPLTGENRVLVAEGLRRINDPNIPTPVLDQLLATAKRPIEVRDLVFVAAPRINAAGRMAHANMAIALLTGQDPSILEKIEQLNQQRRSLDKDIFEEAYAQVAEAHDEEAPATVVFSETWHKGVIGIVASRLMEHYYRPTIVFTRSGDVLSGSARSVEGYDLYKALGKCKQYLIQYGGHKAAAGMTLRPEHYQNFKKQFQKVVARDLPLSYRMPLLTLSAELSLSDITYDFYHELQKLAPFGPENMDPVFYAHGVLAKQVRRIGKDFSHLRMILTDPKSNHDFVAVGFGLGYQESLIGSGQPLTIAYQLTENEWQGRKSLELILKAVKPMTNE
nr:single-stranded-DNA-specific exonuclease RecJ [uncultured Capnocytophaga sp.]